LMLEMTWSILDRLDWYIPLLAQRQVKEKDIKVS